MLKYFVGIVREMKKVQQTKIYLLPISQVITTFLDNLKEFVNQDTLKGFEETFFDLIEYINRRFEKILKELQSVSGIFLALFRVLHQLHGQSNPEVLRGVAALLPAHLHPALY